DERSAAVIIAEQGVAFAGLVAPRVKALPGRGGEIPFAGEELPRPEEAGRGEEVLTGGAGVGRQIPENAQRTAGTITGALQHVAARAGGVEVRASLGVPAGEGVV